MGICRIWGWFWIRWKSWKKFHTKKVINKTVNSCSQLCFNYNFFCVNFMKLFNEFEISLKFCTCWYPFKIFFKTFFPLFLALLLTLGLTRTKRLKKQKIYYKCVLEFTLATINSRVAPFCQKKSKYGCTLMYICTDVCLYVCINVCIHILYCGEPHLCGQLPINRRQIRFILL